MNFKWNERIELQPGLPSWKKQSRLAKPGSLKIDMDVLLFWGIELHQLIHCLHKVSIENIVSIETRTKN